MKNLHLEHEEHEKMLRDRARNTFLLVWGALLTLLIAVVIK